MALQLIEFDDPRAYANAALPWLLNAECENCTQIGLIQRLVSGPAVMRFSDDLEKPLLWLVQDSHGPGLAATQARAELMFVSRGTVDAMRLLAGAMATRRWGGKEIVGIVPSVTWLAEHYAREAGLCSRRMVHLRTFQLTSLTWPRRASGCMRACTPGDRDMVGQWLHEFGHEIGTPEPFASCLDMADRRISLGQLFVWLDPHPVALAGFGGPTPSGIRINAVYTPAAFRRRGYAANLVASLTARLLAEGRKFCFLHTDVSNPTSNGIYQKMGYQPVCDAERWRFENPV